MHHAAQLHVIPEAFQSLGAVQREPEVGAGKNGTVVAHLDVVATARVVEARRALELESHLTAHPAHGPHDAVAASGSRRLVEDRHEVDELGDAVFRHEARDEDRRVGKVQLLDDAVLILRSDTKVAAAVVVQQAGEDAGGVEARATETVDRAVGGCQSGGLEVADQPVLGDAGMWWSGTHVQFLSSICLAKDRSAQNSKSLHGWLKVGYIE